MLVWGKGIRLIWMVGQCGIGSRGFAMDWWIGLGLGDWDGIGWLVDNWLVDFVPAYWQQTFHLQIGNGSTAEWHRIGAALALDRRQWIRLEEAWQGFSPDWRWIGRGLKMDWHLTVDGSVGFVLRRDTSVGSPIVHLFPGYLRKWSPIGKRLACPVSMHVNRCQSNFEYWSIYMLIFKLILCWCS